VQNPDFKSQYCQKKERKTVKKKEKEKENEIRVTELRKDLEKKNKDIAEMKVIFLFFFLWWYRGLNSGPLPFEPLYQPLKVILKAIIS
jgi:hypothetical protein